MRINFKKLYFYSLLFGSIFLLVLQTTFNILENENVINARNMIAIVAVLIGLIGTIIVRKTEQK